jgi:hypothetical protein
METEARERARAMQARLEAEARERARIERIACEAAEAALAKAQNREPEPVHVEPEVVIPILMPPIVPARTEVKTDSGTARLKTVTKFEITDLQGLPVECYTARAEAIIKAVEPWVNAQIKAGRRDIPGVRVYDVQEMKTTTKRGF